MRRGVSSDGEFENSSRRKYSRETEDWARHRAQTKGGEWEDFAEEAEQASKSRREPPEYNDDVLVHAGFHRAKEYDYCDQDGVMLYQSVRYEHTQVPGAKQFRQRRKAKNGKWYADAGLTKVPYRWANIVARPNDPIFYTEGEKDADRLEELGMLATTVAGQQWSPEAAKAFKGRDIVILGDNDDAGRKNVQNAVAALQGFAASVRVVELPGLGRTEDVTDWLAKEGNTKDKLLEVVSNARSSGIRPTPTPLLDPKKIPLRRWLYKPNYIRQFVSLLISTGGVGKSSLAITEALALATGKPLLRMIPDEGAQRVWYWNGEDPIDELHRRVAAASKHYGLSEEDIGDRLFVDSGRTMPIVIAEEDKRVVRLNQAVVDELIYQITQNEIDVVIVDPFVSTHRVSENDNAAIDLIAKAWNRIAEITNCAVLLVHHSRKPNGGEMTVDDTRGASVCLRLREVPARSIP